MSERRKTRRLTRDAGIMNSKEEQNKETDAERSLVSDVLIDNSNAEETRREDSDVN